MIDFLKELSVSEISYLVKNHLMNSFFGLRIKGEVFQTSRSGAGHVYLTLKDDNNILCAVIWNGSLSNDASPCVGDEVILSGYLTAYKSAYQLVVKAVEKAGLGFIHKDFDILRKKLFSEGIFDDSKKKSLPILPCRVGIITSMQGAVFHDMMRVLDSMCPVLVQVFPVAVQGDNTVSDVVCALDRFHELTLRPDVIILARGGGSFEDLKAFNSEKLIRCMAKSEIPIVSAIGHETDVTLADFVADVSASTPTAAMMRVLPDKELLRRKLDGDIAKIRSLVVERLYSCSSKLSDLKGFLSSWSQSISLMRFRLSEMHVLLRSSFFTLFNSRVYKLDSMHAKLRCYDLDRILGLGYAIPYYYKSDNVVYEPLGLRQGDMITLRMKDELVNCKIV